MSHRMLFINTSTGDNGGVTGCCLKIPVQEITGESQDVVYKYQHRREQGSHRMLFINTSTGDNVGHRMLFINTSTGENTGVTGCCL